MTNTAASSARGPEERKCNLGVLFVHGIGAQQRGASLSAFGRPVCIWLRERFAGHDQKWRDALSDQPELIEWWQHIENWATDGFIGTTPQPPSRSGAHPFEITRKIGKEKKWERWWAELRWLTTESPIPAMQTRQPTPSCRSVV